MLLLITECGAPKVSQEDDLPPRRQLEPWSQIKRLPPRSGGGHGLGSPSLIPPQIHTNMSDGARARVAVLHTQIHPNLAVLTARRAALNSPRKCEKNLLSSAGSRAAPPSVKEFVGVISQTCCRGGSVSRGRAAALFPQSAAPDLQTRQQALAVGLEDEGVCNFGRF